MWFTPDGLVKEQHTYVDIGTIMSQIGVSKAEGPSGSDASVDAPTVVVVDEQRRRDEERRSREKMFGAFEKKSEATTSSAARRTTSPGTT